MASIRRRVRSDGAVTYQVRGRGLETQSFTRKRDAETYRDNTERRSKLGPLFDAEPETVGEAVDAYLNRKAAFGWKESTRRRAEESALNLARLGDVLVPRLTPRLANETLIEIATRAPVQAQKARALLIASLRDAQDSRGQRVDPALFRLDQIRSQERQAIALTGEQLSELASWLPDYIFRIVLVAGLTGMRQGELFALRDSDLHLDESYLMVQSGKTRAARRKVQLSPAGVTLLREQLAARPPSVYVFPTPTGKLWDGNRFMGRVFRPARDLAGLERLTFHDLRHTAVSLMAASGMRPEHIAAQIGHADGGALIFRRYRHLFAHEITDALARLDDYTGTDVLAVDARENDGHSVDTERKAS